MPSIYATHDDAVRLMVIQLGSGCSFCPELEDLIPLKLILIIILSHIKEKLSYLSV